MSDKYKDKYVENRIWFLGHLLNTQKNDVRYKSYTFNAYSQNDYLSNIIDNEKLKNINIYETHRLESCYINFLNNGCINVLTVYESLDGNIIGDEEGAKKFIDINNELINIIEDLIRNLVNSSLITLNEYFVWGIPKAMCNVDGVDISTITSFRHSNYLSPNDCVLYTQNYITSDDTLYNISDKCITLQGKQIEKNFDIKLNWGSRYFIIQDDILINDILNDILSVIQSDIYILSKKVILTTSLNIFTELAKFVMYDKSVRNNLSIEELTHLIVSFRCFYQMNEIITQNFDEFTFDYNKISTDIEVDLLELRSNQIESEKTLMNIVEYYDRAHEDKSNKITQLILAVIGCLTIYSVIGDIFNFLPLDEEHPVKFSRLTIMLIVTFIIFIMGIYLRRIIISSRK